MCKSAESGERCAAGTTDSESSPAWNAKPLAAASETADSDSYARRVVSGLLELADIRIGGNRPWDIQVHDPRFFRRTLRQSNLGAGEAYMDGWWDVEAPDEMFARLYAAKPLSQLGKISTLLLSLRARLFNQQAGGRAAHVARRHYDLGNDLFQTMLDRRMQYTCAYWPGARNLDEAQENKLRLIAQKLHLEAGMDILELGGGFGGLAHFLATEYGCRVVSYNISREQMDYARELCRGLPVRFELKDYREAARESQRFHRVAAIGLCEHIGYKNYRQFLRIVRDRLMDGGLFLIHTIGNNRSVTTTDAWIEKYIFPNGVIPSIAQLGAAIENGWVVEDWHNFGPDYDPTLLAWWNNFDRGWPLLREKYGQRFYRMWRYYLLSCAGTFRAREMQLWQIVLSKGDIPAYTPVR